MRRGSNFGGIFIFGGFLIIPLILNLFELLIPLVICGVIGVFVYKKIKSSKKENTTSKTRRNDTVNYNTQKSKPDVVISNSQLSKIDKKLADYFKNNMSLPIVDDIALTPQNGKFTTVDQLCLVYKNEKIIRLVNFKKKYKDTYNEIMELLLAYSKSDKEMNKKETVTEVSKETISDAQKFIDKIDKLNNQIPQEEITNDLYQTCDLLKQIDLLKESKSDKEKVRKLYDYYLPILVSVLENYKKLQDSPVHGEEFNKCETQLIKTIVLINEALKTMCSSLQEDDYMNINADISTLQSLLKKDGFNTSSIKGEKK